jgi:type I restriction enzyme M protein
LLVEVLEPFQGRVLDPARGSGGRFVQSARFVSEHRAEHRKTGAAGDLAICGVEKVDETGRLCRLNLAVHGLEGNISHGGEINSYYDDPHSLAGRFDYVLANPPFNVNNVDKDRIKGSVGPGRRFPFGIPKPDNANYLWIQLFYAALNPGGRAGFVMANSASDARSSELELRRQLLQAHAVDAVVSVGSNMFYTVTLPCTLWFLDRGKADNKRSEQVLFLDARNVFRQVDRAHRDWTPGQIGFLANVVRLYRGEEIDVVYGGDEASGKLREVFGKKPKYADVPGLCKVATLTEIEAQGFSLNPGRYVGVAPGEEVSDEDFKAQFAALHEEFESLTGEARKLENTIARNAAEILIEGR